MNNTNEGVDTPNNCTTNFLDSFVSNFLSDCLKSFSDALFELAYDSDNLELRAYYSKNFKYSKFNDVTIKEAVNMSLGRPLSFYGTVSQEDYDRYAGILTNSAAAFLPAMRNSIAYSLHILFVASLFIANNLPCANKAVEVYNNRRDYYDRCYKEFLSYTICTEELIGKFDLISGDFTSETEAAGRCVFKIALPHILNMSDKSSLDMCSVINQLHSSISRYIKNNHDMNIQGFIKKYGLDEFDASRPSSQALACAFFMGGLSLGFFGEIVCIDPHSDVGYALISLACSSTGFSYIFNSKDDDGYCNEIKRQISESYALNGVSDEEMIRTLFHNVLSSLSIDKTIKSIISSFVNNMLDLVADCDMWFLDDFLPSIADYIIDSYLNIMSFDAKESEIKCIQDDAEHLCTMLASWLHLLITPSSFMPSFYAGHQFFAVSSVDILEAAFLLVSSEDFKRLEQYDSVESAFSYGKDFIMLLYLRIIYRDYHSLRQRLKYTEPAFNNTDDTASDGTVSAGQTPAQEHNEIDTEADKKIAELMRENSRKDKTISLQAHDISVLQKENDVLREQLQALTNKSEDTIKETVSDEAELSPDEMADYINSSKKKILVVGGLDTTNRKLSEKIEKINFVFSDKFDEKLIWTYDIIFINASFMNHHTSYKVDTLCKRAGKKFYYLNGSNSTLNLKKIYLSVRKEMDI